MAKRDTKPGLSFYKLDTDRYLDRRVKQLKHSFGAVGMAIYDYLLCEIYRDKGCFIAWDENTAFDVSEYFGLKENTVKETVSYCATVGLFDLGVFRSENVLTSLSIQKRYIEVCVNAKRVNFEIPENIKIVTEFKDKPPDNKPKPPEENDNVIKGNSKEVREKKFRDGVAAVASNYEKKMIDQFCDYWTESGEKDKKIRFEKQDVFDISRRLKTWETRSKEKNSGKKETTQNLSGQTYGIDY